MQQVKSKGFSLLLYVLGFLLFWEWLKPISAIANTDDSSLFIFFAAFSFLLSYMQWPLWLTFPTKLVAMLFAMHTLFFINSSIFNIQWLIYLVDDTIKNVTFMFNGNWGGLSNLFRTFLFFVLLWLVSFLMHHWLIQTRRLFLFFFITVFYLAILDTFTMYQADGAIVRTMVIGLILLGLLRIANLQEREHVTFEKGKLPISLFVALVIMIGFVSVVGYAAPKAGPQWPDPVPFITKAANGYGDNEKGNGTGMQKIGYDADDTQLGGPFEMDNTPIFETITKNSTYWRVETKGVYTGKGWESASDSMTKMTNKPYNTYSILNLYEKETKIEDDNAVISYKGKQFPQLIYGGELKDVSGIKADLQLNEVTGKIEPMKVTRHITPKKYTLTYQHPTFSVERLKAVTSDENDPQSMKEQYLQLPKELPKRVKQLALKITGGKTNRYDKANAIVDYFVANDYQYNTENVPVPSEGQDYVDQFLFESKQGYCDNFSTSMAVMLRTIGIPARWVKGFSEGEYIDTVGDGRSKYELKNSDAHSWVEAYFPGSGWVPFEPTKGFNNIFSFNYNTESQASGAATVTKEKETAQPKSKQPLKAQASAPDHTESISLKNVSPKMAVFGIAAIILIIIIMAWVLFQTRKKWLPSLILQRYKYRKDKDVFEKAFISLVKLLDLYGMKKPAHQTLREFAYVVDRKLDTKDMKSLTLDFEQEQYSREPEQDQWKQSKELWENIIKKLQA